MATYAELSAKLLHDAATFFRNVGAQNPDLAEQMEDNAAVYDQVADLLAQNPLGVIDLETGLPSTPATPG
jgi:cAMP phosphodiesterase